MDKFMSSTWFVRIASLVIAALLFVSVNVEINSDKKALTFSTSPELDTVTIENVPVEVYYDMENLVVSGIPDNVDVTLKGAKPLVTAAKNQRDFTVYVDLSDPNITLGKRTVTFKISDINEKLVATIEPEYAEVNVQEKVTKEFSFDFEYNSSAIEEGYSVGAPRITPEMVKITGSKEIIDQIFSVKATLGLNQGIKETVQGKATVRALDRELNKLDVLIEPSSVDVTLEISIASKSVNITPVQKGKAKEGIAIKSISVEPKTVTLSGEEDVLNTIKDIDLAVDVSGVTKDTELELTLPKPDHVKAMSTSTVQVKIDVEKEEQVEEEPQQVEEKVEEKEQEQQEKEQPKNTELSKKFTNLRIGVINIEENQIVDINPKTADITVVGASEDIKNMTAEDIELFVDVSDLPAGEHEAPIVVTELKNVDYELSATKAKIAITEKEETDL